MNSIGNITPCHEFVNLAIVTMRAGHRVGFGINLAHVKKQAKGAPPPSRPVDEGSPAPDRGAPLIVGLSTAIAFLPALRNGFVWDDEANLLNNSLYRGLDWSRLKWMATTFHMGPYQPLSWLTLGLDYVIWGMNPTGYHLTNLLLHVANALLMYWLALRLLRLGTAHESSDTTLRLGAACAALVFSLHPLRVESVAWITERRDVLSGFFFLGTILAYLRFNEFRTDRRRWYALSLASYACSLLSKATGVSLPILLVVLDLYPLRRATVLGENSRAMWRPLLIEKVPYAALALTAAVVAPIAQATAGALVPLQSRGIPVRLLQATYGVGFYIWKTLIPVNLSPFYRFPSNSDLLWRGALVSGCAVVVISGITMRTLRRYPALLAVWFSYLVMLLPVLGLIPAGDQIAADRYTYLPCLALALAAGAGFAHINARVGAGGRRMMLLISGGAFMALSALTWKQIGAWRTSTSLWSHTLSIDPDSYLAHTNLGIALEENGSRDEAASHYTKAIENNPSYARAYENFGNLRMSQGQMAEATNLLERAAQLEPNNAKVYYNLANALYKDGQLEAAIAHYKKAIELNHRYAEAFLNLACALHDQGRTRDAILNGEEAIKVKPDFPVAYVTLGVMQASEGRYPEAIQNYRRALDLNPGLAEAHFNWGNALARQQQFTEAIQHYERALEINPKYASARSNLNRALRESSHSAH